MKQRDIGVYMYCFSLKHLTTDQEVGGSNPPGRANLFNELETLFLSREILGTVLGTV